MRALAPAVLVVFVAVSCRHVPTRDEVVTVEVQQSAGVLADSLVAGLRANPAVPPEFTTDQARESFKTGFENEFARVSGVPPEQARQTLASAAEALRPTDETKRAFVAVTAALILAIPDLIKTGKVVAEVGTEVLKVLIQIPGALLLGLK
jgi:hypothetical protein